METIQASSNKELDRRASELIPLSREKSLWMDENRRMHDDVIDVPIQRIERDVPTLNLHAILRSNTNFELYGRIVCGLDSNTPYI